MYNNLTFLNNSVNKAQMLIHLTLWTFSVGSKQRGRGISNVKFLFAEKRHNPCRYRIKCLILQPISPNMSINCDNNYV